ncbi:hypothetical protein RclHR1_04330006 [Rhizophagus clarus]|uniref:Crinkler effector protein N-terminal domain-containing protein n=1 Tax=Rhizophagus clarus TaxID=94130 RepID=A0A2Z6RGE2_9GLOM|nr:hypothetical protein RclHR1_04330004 [Rhizophagus clarus]GBC01788.1 hypothetical protein RclHR1_04330006 [Rhizophagus clarus]
MFGKKTLFCLIFRHTEDAAFSIKYNSNMFISDLKDVIYNLRRNDFSNTESHRLALYRVNIDLTTVNPQRTALSNQNVDVVNDLGGQLLLSIDEIFQDPPKKSIHLIIFIIVPRTAPTGGVAPSAGRAATDDSGRYFNEILAKLDTCIQEIKRLQQDSEVVISSANSSHWRKIREFLGLEEVITTPVNVTDLTIPDNVPDFDWDGRIENVQRDNYIPHLQLILQIDDYDTLAIYDTSGKNNFLTLGANRYLPIKISGTTDVVIVDRLSIQSQLTKDNVRIVMELKESSRKSCTTSYDRVSCSGFKI